MTSYFIIHKKTRKTNLIGGYPIKKTSIILLVLVLIGSSFSATAFIAQQKNLNTKEHFETITWAEPVLTTQEAFTKVTIDQATSYHVKTGEPMLPKITKTFTLPIGSQITKINIAHDTPIRQSLDSPILPAQEPLIDGETQSKTKFSQAVYESNSIYPSEPYTTQKSIGLKNNQHVLYYSIHYYPVRYNPVENTIYYTDNIDITIEYQTPLSPVQVQSIDEQDLLVIYPELFTDEIQPLITHKNN
ncbi:MAG: hypothetical protein KGY50_00350, partial [Candidatus Thermoplasmatota archaeon]|nr:hypothetical protein [Candidatus Thermoplasmatota archaeon]